MAGALLFAYGTLRDARLRAQVLRGAPSREIGTGTAPGALYHLGDYPGMVAGEPDDRVPGVVIELVDDASLALLDEYEDIASGLYIRERTTVHLDDGCDLEVWVYLYNRPIEDHRRIPSWP